MMACAFFGPMPGSASSSARLALFKLTFWPGASLGEAGEPVGAADLAAAGATGAERSAAFETEPGAVGIFGFAFGAVHRRPLRELLQQRLRLFQVRRVEPLGEPAVDLAEYAPRLVSPQRQA
jgi:hypothetical protein